MSGHAEGFGIGKLWLCEQRLEGLMGAALMRHHPAARHITAQGNDLDGQSTDVYANVGHGVACSIRLFDVKGALRLRLVEVPPERLSLKPNPSFGVTGRDTALNEERK
ncbi:MAG: hypothetical protein ACYSU7_09935 [Planctomycetota bacterium]